MCERLKFCCKNGQVKKVIVELFIKNGSRFYPLSIIRIYIYRPRQYEQAYKNYHINFLNFHLTVIIYLNN